MRSTFHHVFEDLGSIRPELLGGDAGPHHEVKVCCRSLVEAQRFKAQPPQVPIVLAELSDANALFEGRAQLLRRCEIDERMPNDLASVF
jgi:hypothetical protein